jgi:hypothetical protein
MTNTQTRAGAVAALPALRRRPRHRVGRQEAMSGTALTAR